MGNGRLSFRVEPKQQQIFKAILAENIVFDDMISHLKADFKELKKS